MKDIKLVIFDINHTLIEDNSWAKLNVAFGMTEAEDKQLWEQNQKGLLSNEQWVEALNHIFRSRGIASKQIYDRVCSTYSWKEGAKELVNSLQNKGYKIALISGAMQGLVDSVAQALGGVDYVYSGASFIFNQAGKFISFTYYDEEVNLKATQLSDLVQRSGIAPKNMAVVADGANDEALFKACAVSISFKDDETNSASTHEIRTLLDVNNIL